MRNITELLNEAKDEPKSDLGEYNKDDLISFLNQKYNKGRNIYLTHGFRFNGRGNTGMDIKATDDDIKNMLDKMVYANVSITKDSIYIDWFSESDLYC
jgi:hypothetical protein